MRSVRSGTVQRSIIRATTARGTGSRLDRLRRSSSTEEVSQYTTWVRLARFRGIVAGPANEIAPPPCILARLCAEAGDDRAAN